MWGSKIAQWPPTVAYEDAMNEDDRGLYNWLKNIVSVAFFHVLISIYTPSPG